MRTDEITLADWLDRATDAMVKATSYDYEFQVKDSTGEVLVFRLSYLGLAGDEERSVALKPHRTVQ